LTQHKYATELHKKVGIIGCKSVSTLLSTLEKLSAYSGELLEPNDATNYWSTMGGLQYLTLTRSYINFSLNKICQFLHTSTTVHLTVAK
jgi:hypothetical protein